MIIRKEIIHNKLKKKTNSYLDDILHSKKAEDWSC